VLRSLFAGVALAAIALPAAADDFRTVEYAPFVQTTVACPVNLLCVLRLQPGERIRNGLNSQLPAWESNDIYEGGDQQTPMLTFKPAAAGQRANVIVTTNRRTYIFLLESTSGNRPTYLRFAFDVEAKRQARAHPSSTPRPLTVAEQLEAACSWMSTNAVGESYNADAKPVALRPTRVCHDARSTWIALPPLQTVANDLPVLLELTAQGERVANYTMFASDRIIRVDGVGAGYVLHAGGKEAMHVRRFVSAPARTSAAPTPSSTSTPESTLTSLLQGDRGGR
jgi:type IV secretory pathway VirB9-like protein